MPDGRIGPKVNKGSHRTDGPGFSTHRVVIRDPESYELGSQVRAILPHLTKNDAWVHEDLPRGPMQCAFCGRTATRRGVLIIENGGWRCAARKQCERNV